MALDFDTCYRAVLARDARFDGRFFTAVTSTGIYCRPVCPARTPARRHVRFFPHAGAAEAAGFRACRRCRPETSPGSPEWNARADLTGRAVRLISDGYVDEHGVAGLASRLAVTERHLRRLLVAELGAGPLALARTTRLQTARRLLAETAMPVSDIAFASGFASIRQFNASFTESYGMSPSALRSRPHHPGAGAAEGTWLTLRLACREPFDSGTLLGFLAARAIPGVEEVSATRYARTVHAPGGPGVVELVIPPAPGARGGSASNGVGRGLRQVVLRVRLQRLRGVGQVVARCRQVLDLDADPVAIAAVLGADPVLAPLVARHPGLRVPGAYDGFELAVRAVLGQQVSVASARTLAGRLAAGYGTPLALAAVDGPSGAAPASRPAGKRLAHPEVAETGRRPQVRLLFPRPEDLADADLTGLGLTTSRQVTLRALAAAVATGRLTLDHGADPEEAAARLAELPGVGPWTVAYVLMRAVGDPDAFPATDLGLHRALARLGVTPKHAQHWRPWRSYAALHLWTHESPDEEGNQECPE
ncbi:MAG TPA: AlkA N-terminal domain-containing protein [Streptosporangiaceae bacterium]|nr:AlkA N-terminal domain-containing protein [Streptosporangiaceae bacterium]